VGRSAPHVGAAHRGAGGDPTDARRNEDAPTDVADQVESFRDAVRRVWDRRRGRVIGWIVLVAVAAIWESFGLWPPHFSTLSHIVKTLQPPFPGGKIVIAVWLVVGGYVFGY
jgi:hypothetical protein